MNKTKRAAALASLKLKEKQTNTCMTYTAEIREPIRERRKARRIWHNTRNPSDKNVFNHISIKVNMLIKNLNWRAP